VVSGIADRRGRRNGIAEREEKTETGGMADLLQRLNETSDDDPLK